MNEAFGGAFNIVIIIVFLVLISGYMAFNVNYSKAFKVKNKIIYEYEAYDGNCDSYTNCKSNINDYMNAVGYNARFATSSAKGYDCSEGKYCVKKIVETDNNKFYYRVVTLVNFDIPIVKKVISYIPYLQVTGDTKKMDCPSTGC